MTTKLSGLQKRLDQMLQASVPELAEDYAFVFERTRTKDPHGAKWVFTAHIHGRKKPLVIKSLIPARDLVKQSHRLVVVSQNRDEMWVTSAPNHDGLIAQLKASPLWTPAVRKAIERAVADLKDAS